MQRATARAVLPGVFAQAADGCDGEFTADERHPRT